MKHKDWFSRRHKSNLAHTLEGERKRARIASWQETMAENEKARARRSPAEQLGVLDLRLGVGQGAKRERKRLAALPKSKRKLP